MSEKVKNHTILKTLKALSGLDGNPNDKDRTIFKFSGLTAYALAKNMRRLSEAAEDLEKARVALVRKHNLNAKRRPDGNLLPDSPEVLALFQTEYEELMQATTDLVLTKFKIKDFDLDNNRIPLWIIAELDWLIIE